MSNFIDEEAEFSDAAESARSDTSEPIAKKPKRQKEKKRRQQIRFSPMIDIFTK
jgi:hypothetical protein